MPCTWQIDTDLGLVRVRIWGAVDHAELVAAQRQMTEHPAFRPHFSELIDLSELTTPRVNGAEIQQLARNAPFLPSARRAFVAPANFAFGLARMYESYREPISPTDQIRVFRKLRDAEEWLGLPASRITAA